MDNIPVRYPITVLPASGNGIDPDIVAVLRVDPRFAKTKLIAVAGGYIHYSLAKAGIKLGGLFLLDTLCVDWTGAFVSPDTLARYHDHIRTAFTDDTDRLAFVLTGGWTPTTTCVYNLWRVDDTAAGRDGFDVSVSGLSNPITRLADRLF